MASFDNSSNSPASTAPTECSHISHISRSVEDIEKMLIDQGYFSERIFEVRKADINFRSNLETYFRNSDVVLAALRQILNEETGNNVKQIMEQFLTDSLSIIGAGKIAKIITQMYVALSLSDCKVERLIHSEMERLKTLLMDLELEMQNLKDIIWGYFKKLEARSNGSPNNSTRSHAVSSSTDSEGSHVGSNDP